MRKFMVLPIAGLLALGVVGPVSAKPNVTNTSGAGESIYGEWSANGTSGYMFLGEDSVYGGFGDIYQETGEWVECDPTAAPAIKGTTPVPDDTSPGPEIYGFVGTRTYGSSSDIRIDFSRRLATGTASGSVEVYTDTVDECNGIYAGEPVVETADLHVTLASAGPLATFRGHGNYKIPSEFNGHENYRGQERAATGSVIAGSTIEATFGGYMSAVTWTDHVNR
jgi:hypothetical protein